MDKKLDGDACFPDEASQCSLSQGFMVWDSQSTVRRLMMPQDHVTACLVIDKIANFLETL